MKIVFTNGVWDMFHYGHYNLLRRAKELGDYLFVGVATDESCKKYKRKPHQPWEIRAHSVKNLPFVNEVVETPWSRDLTEDFFKKYHIDYQVQGDAGSEFNLAKKLGKLMVLGRTEGISTTRIEEIVTHKDNKILYGGYINEIKQAFADNKLYAIKQGTRIRGKLYDVEAPPTRIYNEYEAIMAFREALHNPDYIVNPVLFDPESHTIVFESSPMQANLLSEKLLHETVSEIKIKEITKGLSNMHNATLDNKELKERFSNSDCFLKFKIELQALNITKDSKIKNEIKQLVEYSLGIKRVLLHGDPAPKNIFVWNKRFMFIDFEESAFCDPSIDIGYFIAHLILYDQEKLAEIAYKTYLSSCKYKDATLKERISKYIGIFILSRIDGLAKADFIIEGRKDYFRQLSKPYIMGEKTYGT